MIIGLCPQTVYAENETGQAENSQKQEYGHMVPAFLKSMMPEA